MVVGPVADDALCLHIFVFGRRGYGSQVSRVIYHANEWERTLSQTRFEKLQDAIKAYGGAAFENLMRCKGLADALVDGFAEYLGAPSDCIRAVPADGQFDPHKDYGDEAFSYSKRQVVVLEPVIFGICVTVNNWEDSGALWLRTPVAIEVSGDNFEVFVGKQSVKKVPLGYQGQLEEKLAPVFEAVYQELLSTFRIEFLEFNDKRFAQGIGFRPND